MKTVIGIDPGANGGIACLEKDTNRLVWVERMPMIGKEPNLREIYDLLKQPDCVHIYLEHAQAMPKQGTVSMFNYGKNFGALLGLISCLSLPHTIIKPRFWQKTAFVGTDTRLKPKERALVAAMRLWQDESFLATKRSKTAHEGCIDSCLIAYGAVNYQA